MQCPSLEIAEKLIKQEHLGPNTSSNNISCCGLYIEVFQIKLLTRHYFIFRIGADYYYF